MLNQIPDITLSLMRFDAHFDFAAANYQMSNKNIMASAFKNLHQIHSDTERKNFTCFILLPG